MSHTSNLPCLFCGGPGKSPEHLFGKWMGKMVARQQGEKHYTYREGPTGVVRSLGNGRAVVKKVKAPCQKCNNEWMGAIEDSAKKILSQLIRGVPTSLDARQQLAIATWVTIKAMAWDYVQTLRAIPEGDRDHVYAIKEPPPDWRVWLAQTDAPFGHCEAYSAVRLITIDRADGSLWPQITKDPLANTQCFLLLSGPFLAVSLRCPFLTKGAVCDPGEAFSPIWPLASKTDWPPKPIIPVDHAVGMTVVFIDSIRRGLGLIP